MMADDSEFITRLIGFGLSEKEAQLYLHLLKYGAKPPSLLAKSLTTYREDVHRTLTGLIGKGMVNPSIETPTLYAAVELDVALESALKKHESELREMERRKEELLELSKQQQFRPSDEFSTFRIIRTLKEGFEVTIPALVSVEQEWVLAISEIMFLASALYGLLEEDVKLIDRGVKIKAVTNISYPYTELIQQHLDVGVDIRHYDQYQGIIFGVWDRKFCASAINVDIKRASLDEPFLVLWTDDSAFVDYHVSTFELLWEQAVPAAQRIEELLKEGPPQV
jgi:sugar-specific transcriptional regulator TrmB